MTSEDTSQHIATIPKNAREEIRIGLSEFMGHDLLDIRVYADDGAKHVPSKKGLSVRVERLRDLQAALSEAEAVAVKNGLLPEIQEAAQ